MDYILKGIIKFRKTILIFFALIILLSFALLSETSVNYRIVDYLPQEANSTQAIKILDQEFEDGFPNLNVMIQNVTIQEALYYKNELNLIPGVESVLWLDDLVGQSYLEKTPVEFMDKALTENYYKEQTALFSLVIKNGTETASTEAIYDLIGESNSISGDALYNASIQNNSSAEVSNAMMILLPILIFMLVVATRSWLEPIFFLITIGIAILINMGSNALFGEISFITNTVSPILQLAVSMDYAIFLLHSFSEKRDRHEPKEAMYLAMKASLPTVAASAFTTMIGFSALIFMRFGIGSDLGFNLLKGIILSFVSVMVFLPVITLVFHNWIDKTMHKDFMPHPGRISQFLLKVKVPLLLIAIIIVLPAFFAQSQVEFLYGMDFNTEGARSTVDKAKIEEMFGNEHALLLLVPREDLMKEKALSEDLKAYPFVTSVMSFAESVGTEVPEDYLDEAIRNQFYSEHYARIILYSHLTKESEENFNHIDEILETASAYYDEYYLTGQTPTLNDMKKVVSVDTGRINLIAVVGIFIVLFLTFRSLVIPLILIFTIESAIWINLSVPYFNDTAISFIGYLIISTVQLGATVDYAILMTHRYMDNRRVENKRDAMWHALKNNIAAVLISATILATAGFALAATSQQPVIQDLGLLLGRGTVLSFTMVVTVLPALMLLLDGWIKRTTLNHGFYSNKEVK